MTGGVPIAELHPDVRDVDDRDVEGVVTLIWPYASASHSSSLLLVEPDFRLRARRGQVRLYFSGPSAKEVLRAGVTSGDQLLVSLKGASFEKDGSTASTPGRGIEWRLQYGEYLNAKVSGSELWERAPIEGRRYNESLARLYLFLLTILIPHQKRRREVPPQASRLPLMAMLLPPLIVHIFACLTILRHGPHQHSSSVVAPLLRHTTHSWRKKTSLTTRGARRPNLEQVADSGDSLNVHLAP